MVANGASFAFDRRFGLILSCECLEHNPEWDPTLRNAAAHLRHDGLLVLTFATIGRMEHGTSRSFPDYSPATVARGWEYYRNLTTVEVADVLEQCGLTVWRAANFRAFDGYIVASPDPRVIDDASHWVGPLRAFRRRLLLRNVTPLALITRVSHRLTGTRQPDELPRPIQTLRRTVKRTELILRKILAAGVWKGR